MARLIPALLLAAAIVIPAVAMATGSRNAAQRVTVSPPPEWKTLASDETLPEIPGLIPGLGYANEKVPAVVYVAAYDTQTIGSPENVAKLVQLQFRSAGAEVSRITVFFGGIEAKFTWTDKRSGTSGVYDIWEAPNVPEVIVGFLGIWPEGNDAAAAQALPSFFESISVK